MSAPTIDFGLQFFPDVGPDEKSAQAYWNESLTLVGLADDPALRLLVYPQHLEHNETI